MELINKCYDILFTGVLIALALAALVAFIYMIRSHLTVDRIIGLNLIGTIVVIVIAILTHTLGQAYLADVALVYVVMSFIAVMMLCRIYINLYDRRRKEGKQ